MIDSANKDLLKDILPVIDDYERAIKANKESEFEGFNLIFQKLKNTLENYNVKKMQIKKVDGCLFCLFVCFFVVFVAVVICLFVFVCRCF